MYNTNRASTPPDDHTMRMKTMSNQKIQQEVDQNYAAFQKILPGLMQKNPGKWALLHKGEVEAVFDTAVDACITGEKLYADKLFSIQEITDHVVDLGWHSHVVS